jgi:hypothetical protein
MENSKLNWNFRSVCIVTYRCNNYEMTQELRHTTMHHQCNPSTGYEVIDQLNRELALYR